MPQWQRANHSSAPRGVGGGRARRFGTRRESVGGRVSAYSVFRIRNGRRQTAAVGVAAMNLSNGFTRWYRRPLSARYIC